MFGQSGQIHDFNPDTTNNNRFTGKYLDSDATMSWSAAQHSTGVTFHTAQPDKTMKTVSGVIGHERNGVFFDSEED